MATSAPQDGDYGSSNHQSVARPVLTGGYQHFQTREPLVLNRSLAAVVRASDLPRLTTSTSGKERKFYVTATDGVRTKRTSTGQSKGWSVRWDETLSGFEISPTSRLVVHVVAQRRLLNDILLGPLVISFESLRPFSNREFDLPVISAFQQPTLVLSISLPEALPHQVATTVGSPGVSAESNQVSDVSPGATPGNLPDDNLIDQTNAAASLSAAEEAMPNVKTPRGPLLKSMEAAANAPDNLQKVSEFYDTWSLVLKNVKWVVDVVDKIAEVERDKGVKSLLVAIRDAFNLTDSVDAIQLRKLGMKQTSILNEMLHHVCDCGDFIKEYAGDERFRDRLRKHLVDGTNEQIKRYGDRLGYLRSQFLDHGAIAIQNTVYQIHDDLGELRDGLSQIPKRLDGLAIRIEQVASEVADV
ncbi:hypothetical protein BC834DRAFT_1008704, partial [Gloeopeniophorella convolvens]